MVRVTVDAGAAPETSSDGELIATSQNQPPFDNIYADTSWIATYIPPFTVIPYNWVEINPARPGALPGATNTGINGDDQNLGPFPIGFNFPFYDCVLHNTIRVCSNGFASFTSTSTSYTNYAIPNTGLPNDLIAPYWDDMNLSLSGYGSVWYLYDVANDRFIVEWDSCAHYSTMGVYSFELILHGNGDVEYQYKELTPGTDLSATVGIENATGTDGIQCTYNGSGPINPVPGMGILIYTRCDLPPPPVVVTIGLAATDPEMVTAILDWDPVPDAAQYKIYKSYTSSTSGFALVDSTTLTQWTDTGVVAGAPTCFYYVTADDVARDHIGAVGGGTFPPANMQHLFQPTHVEDPNIRRK
jgi:hypothetical protein